MSTQSFPLQLLGQNADQDEENADPGCLQEPPEDATKQGTKGSRKVQYWKDWPRKNILITVTSLLGFLSLYTGVSMIAPFYPIVAASHGVAIYIAGFVIATAPLCGSVVSPITGYLKLETFYLVANFPLAWYFFTNICGPAILVVMVAFHLRLNRNDEGLLRLLFVLMQGLKFTQLAGLFLAGGSLILFGFVSMMPTPATFITFSFLLRTTEGIGTAMFNTASYKLLTQLYANKKGTIVGTIELSITLGYVLGAPIGGGLQEAGGFILPFVVVGGCIIVWMLILVVLVQSNECASKTLPCRLSLGLLTNIFIFFLALTLIISNSSVNAVISYFGSFLNSQFNLRVGIVGAIYISGTLLFAISTIVAGPLTDRLVPRYLIIVGLIVGCAGCALVGPTEFITTPKLWLVIPGVVLFGAGIPFALVPIYSDVYSIASNGHKVEDEEAIASTLSGLIVACYSAGGWIGPIFGGVLMYKVGFQSMLSILSLLLLVNAVVLSISTVIHKCYKSWNCRVTP